MIENGKFIEIINNVILGNIIKDKNKQIAVIGELSIDYVKQIEYFFGKKLASKQIAITQNEVWHALRGSKPKHKKANKEDVFNIPKILVDKKHFYFDEKENNLLFFSNTIKHTNNIIYIAVNLNYTKKAFGKNNFVATISKFKKSDYKSRIKTLKKLRG